MGKTFAIKSGTVQRQANYRRKISPQMKTGERESLLSVNSLNLNLRN